LERYLFQENYRIKEIILKTNNMTAVDFIVQKLNPLVNAMPNDIFSTICNIMLEAKKMEKEQITNAHLEGWSDAYDYLQDNGSKPARQAEEYYNETYK
jgi:hypothetical protein